MKIQQLMMCFEGLKIVLDKVSSASLQIQFVAHQTDAGLLLRVTCNV